MNLCYGLHRKGYKAFRLKNDFATDGPILLIIFYSSSAFKTDVGIILFSIYVNNEIFKIFCQIIVSKHYSDSAPVKSTVEKWFSKF
jgi:hypothetical protein